MMADIISALLPTVPPQPIKRHPLDFSVSFRIAVKLAETGLGTDNEDAEIFTGVRIMAWVWMADMRRRVAGIVFMMREFLSLDLVRVLNCFVWG
jgi:hypothetical protein